MRIENHVFQGCDSLTFIRLPRTLVLIGDNAFSGCSSLDAVYLPPTVTHIGGQAFCDCTSLRLCILPELIQHLGDRVFQGCNSRRLSTTSSNNLSKICCSTSVNSQSIQECIDTHGIERATEVNHQQMTALHILCANPHVTGGCIRTYLQLVPEAAEQQDSDGMTPFQRLCRNDVTLLSYRRTAAFLLSWHGGTVCCLPWCFDPQANMALQLVEHRRC